MPEGGTVLNPGAGGDTMDMWIDPVTGRRTQSFRLRDDRGGILYSASSGLITLAATANLQVWGLFNTAAAAGKSLYVHSVFAESHATAAAVTIACVLQRSNLVTTGTALTATRPDNGAVTGLVGVARNLPTGATLTAGFFGSLLLPTVAGATIGPKALHVCSITMQRDLIVPPQAGIVLVASGTPNANHRVSVDAMWEEI